MSIDLAAVRKFGQEAHAGQVYGTEPYWSGHCEKVLARAIELFAASDPAIVNDPEFQAACLLHDTDEDQRGRGFTLEKIEEHFGIKVSKYAFFVTKPEHSKDLKKLRGARRAAKLVWNREHYRWQAIHGPRQSHLIKIADRHVNLDGLNEESKGADFRKFYIDDTKNLIDEYRHAGIHGVEYLDAKLASAIG